MANYRYFETRQRDDVHVVYLASVGADREAVTQFGQDLLEFAKAEKPQRVLISFKSVRELTAPAVGKLLLLAKTVKGQGGQVECCDATEDFRGVLGMLGRSLPFDHAHQPEAEVLGILKGP
jgi:anti-anti-sigma regulatory factor